MSRQDYIKRLAEDPHKPRLQSLLWLLLAAGGWPQRSCRSSSRPGAIAGARLLTPSLPVVLGDEMAQLLPQPDQATTPLAMWRSDGEANLRP